MIFITHEKSGGRAGHQFKDAITPLIIAEIFGFTFVYTRYPSLEFFNLAEGSLSRPDLPAGLSVHRMEGPHWYGISYDALVSQFESLQDATGSNDCLVVLANSFRVQLFQLWEWYASGLMKVNFYPHVIGILRSKFQKRNPRPGYAEPGNSLKIAVHIRRGDLAKPRKRRTPSSQHYAHGMDFYDDILKKLKTLFREKEFHVHIFTEHRNSEDVVAYCKEHRDIILHQGAKEEFANDFTEMVYSDVLVVSNSSMSQMAGYLSEGLKIYYPNDQYHSLPSDEFIPIADLDERILKRT
jgi:hypothetical protein